MYKKVIGMAALLLAFHWGYSQRNSSLQDIHQKRATTLRTGMLTLGGWAAGNLAVSGLLMPKTQGSRYYFHQMNVFWNVVNAGIAGLGYYQATHRQPSLDIASSVSQHYQFQKILLFNAGLDIAYVMTGLYLLEKAKNNAGQETRLKGYGKSVILQGAFLFIFDLALYFILNQQTVSLKTILSNR